MNCADCQNQIFDGELDRSAVAHLTDCGDCQTVEREVKLNITALAELREEIIPVRSSRRRWPWAIGIAAAAAAIVAVAIWPASIPAPAPPEPIAKVEPLSVAPVLPAVSKPAPVRRARSGRPKPAPLIAKTAEPLMVKFFTEDPDVVIYWQIDPPKGDVGL